MATAPKNVKQPTDRKTPAARRKAEESASEYAPLIVAGYEVRVAHPQNWRASSMESLRNGDPLGWAKQNVHPDDYQAFREADPTLGEVGDLVNAATTYFGADTGE